MTAQKKSNVVLASIKGRLRHCHQVDPAMTVEKMAAVAGVSQSTMRRHLNPQDTVKPDLMIVAKLSETFGLSMDWIVYGSAAEWDEDDENADCIFRRSLQHWEQGLTTEDKKGFLTFIKGLTVLAKNTHALD